MLRYALRRIPTAVLTCVVASIGIFWLVQLLPGSPVAMVLGEQATPESVAALEAEAGLDRPFVVQYFDWIGGLLTGDLGVSYVSRLPIADLVGPAVGATLELALASLLVTVVVGLALGITGAVARRRPATVAYRLISAIGFGVPEYVVGVLLVFVFAVTLRTLPAGGRVPLLEDPGTGVQHLVLPAIALSVHSAIVVGRFLETALNQQMDEEYLDTARAKGASRRRVLWRHALPNALPSVVTVIGLRIGHLLGGVVVIETIFAWPGLGTVLVNAVSSRDYLLVQDLVLISVAVFIVVQVGSDLLHAALDPRVRLEA
ncbi:ABC transporter permease [Jiangella aurantiaca]|uniref:ABC transporter permease n=1 Tax=Jiangella aurantiaca TaxID=2530373 RepID=A0A4R5A9G0_9ACTN|nr:ABC transporter permease [Jiangella aurantiaca]TDD67519.1 ABC transporter permease [Jiangella aurantiaca]